MTMGICHKIMKTAEDYIRQINDRLMPHPYNLSRKQRKNIKSLIREIQRDAYNQAIDQILKLMYDHEEEIYIGVFEDIEKLKK
jgi:hypothetical protein